MTYVSAPGVERSSGNSVSLATDEQLSQLVQKVAGRRGLHHVKLAVASTDGRRVWAGSAGPSGQEEENSHWHPDTPFFIASITKRFVVALLLQAYERGEVGLDSRITDLLPSTTTGRLQMRRGADRTHEITVRHLATHTSGLPDHFEKRHSGPSLYAQLAAGKNISWSFEDILRTTREQQGSHFAPQDLSAPDQKARYSDTGLQLLIRILETVTDRSFPELLAERITGPLGLSNTCHPSHPTKPSSPLPTTLYSGQKLMELGALITSSNDLVSTTAELLTFHRALLDGTLFREPATVRLLAERSNRLRNIPILKYGMGTMSFTTHLPGQKLVRRVRLQGHSGATGSWLFRCPDFNLDLCGTVDQVRGQSLPFRIMPACLRAWQE